MIDLSDKYLLMIEPTRERSGKVVDDGLTELAETVFAKAKSNNVRYRGWHTCVCGETSDNNDWILPSGKTTNSLMVHYIRDHRDEVPQSEIDKLLAEGASL